MPIQRSVAQQNAHAKSAMLAVARSFSANPTPLRWAADLLIGRGLDHSDGALVELHELTDQGGDLFTGVWVTRAKQFWRFQVLLPRAAHAAPETEEFENVTNEFPISDRARGTGRTFGKLALEVVDEILAPECSPAKISTAPAARNSDA